MKRRITAVATAIGVALLAPVMLAPSAHAANLGTVVWNGTTLTPSSLNAQALDTFVFQNNTNGDVRLIGNLRNSLNTPCTGSTGECEVGTFMSNTMTVIGVGQVQIQNVRSSAIVANFFTNGSGSSGAGTSESASQPQTFELTITPSDGTVCRQSSESRSGGSWVTLPGASDCTPPATKPNAKLLGWATSPTFPVDIAKRQVANGWGAYETFNADGQLTGVFIPAGGATLVSAAGNLYPVWSE